MASYHELRLVRARPAKAGHRAWSPFGSPLVLADPATTSADTSSVSAQLAGVRDGEALAGAAFRRETLSSPQRCASNAGRPVPHVVSEPGDRRV